MSGAMVIHFHTQCPRWPKIDFVQVPVMNPVESEGERFCQECAKLELQCSQIKTSYTLIPRTPWQDESSALTVSCDTTGRETSPPVWSTASRAVPHGEVGILRKAMMNDRFDNAVYLRMEIDGVIIWEPLLFDFGSCYEIYSRFSAEDPYA
jgi:hypothetical protein